jgi:hypothetical protein
VLVGAVLRPEEREDRELEVVRVALQKVADAVELPVRETERAVERFGDLRQTSIVSGKPDDLRAVSVGRCPRGTAR